MQQLNYTYLKWLKNVTRDKGSSWAYMEYGLGDTFNLNFSKNPKWYPTNYKQAKPGDLLVLFQTVVSSPGFIGGTYVTHLVTPLDNYIDKVDNPNHPYVRLVAVVGVPTNNHPLDSNWSLFKANRGQICFIDTLESKRGDKTIQQKQNYLFNLFNIDDKVISLLSEINITQDKLEEGVTEGSEKTIFRLHKFKERNPQLIAKAKALAIKENRFFCEVCKFNFEIEYPGLGLGFIECHHKMPIAKGGIRNTKIQDLALVCSNCHRMLHRKNINGKYLTIEELRGLKDNNR